MDYNIFIIATLAHTVLIQPELVPDTQPPERGIASHARAC